MDRAAQPSEEVHFSLLQGDPVRSTTQALLLTQKTLIGAQA